MRFGSTMLSAALVKTVENTASSVERCTSATVDEGLLLRVQDMVALAAQTLEAAVAAGGAAQV